MVLFIPAASECLKGVWEVSGGCLSDSGYSLEGGGGKLLIKIQLDSFLLSASSFSCVCRVSGRCLGGVWGLSE